MLRKLLMFCYALTLSLQAQAQTPAKVEPAPQVVFICEHGSAKSVIAASWFNKVAEQRGMSIRAISRGVTPDSQMQEATRIGLDKDGINTSNWVAGQITPDVAKGALRVVSIGLERVPDFLKKETLLEWNNVPPVSKNYDQSRDVMLQHINALIGQIEAK